MATCILFGSWSSVHKPEKAQIKQLFSFSSLKQSGSTSPLNRKGRKNYAIRKPFATAAQIIKTMLVRLIGFGSWGRQTPFITLFATIVDSHNVRHRVACILFERIHLKTVLFTQLTCTAIVAAPTTASYSAIISWQFHRLIVIFADSYIKWILISVKYWHHKLDECIKREFNRAR